MEGESGEGESSSSSLGGCACCFANIRGGIEGQQSGANYPTLVADLRKWGCVGKFRDVGYADCVKKPI